ncbi:MAG: DUF1934 family protein [Firmicutes bacterium]|nr:DUF1934 family protein [Bacillota bacterium]
MTTTNNAKVFLTSTQNGNSTPDFLEFLANVKMENDTVFIEFGDQNKRTQIGICDGLLTLSQFGESVYTVLIKQDQKTHFEHKSEHGTLHISLTPSLVQYQINQNEITIGLEYVLDFEGQEQAHNTFHLRCILDDTCKL